MLESFQRRNNSPETIRLYLFAVKDFTGYFGKGPDQLSSERLRQYQLYLLNERKLSVGCRAAERSHAASETVSVWAAPHLWCRETPMRTPVCSKISESSSMRLLQNAARPWRLVSALALMCGFLGCSPDAAHPAAREALSQTAVSKKPAMPPVHSGAAGADHGSWATAGDSVPEALREPCANVSGIVRSVVDSAPASTNITELVGPRAITFKYQFANAQSAGCEFVARGSDTVSSSNLFEAMEKAFQEARWRSMEATYSADGPDGSDLGYSLNGLLCVIEGRWDGGDDSDPTVIPGPEFDVFVTCAPLRADDQPPSQ
jgi:integrase-like protein